MLSDSSRDPNYDERYYERKAEQRCTKCGVAIGPDRQLCDRHQAAAAKATGASMARLRAERRAAKLCAEGCGRTSGDRYRCETCAPSKRRTAGVNPGVNPRRFHTEGRNRKSSWSWRTEADGKRRKRGVGRGHRGQPTVLETEGFDMHGMAASLDRARAEHAAFWSEENQALPKVQRQALLVSALGQLELAMRSGEELVERWKKRLK